MSSTIKETVKDLQDKIITTVSQSEVSCSETEMIWPPNVIMVARSGTRIVTVVEQQPQIRTISFVGELAEAYGRTESEERQSFRLAFPYVIIVQRWEEGICTGVSIFYSKKSITSVDDTLYRANLPNIDGGTMCVGFSFDEEEPTWRERCDGVIARFWNSTFNNDYSEGFKRMARVDSRFSSLTAWEKASNENALFTLNVDWEESVHTLRERTKEYLGSDYNPLSERLTTTIRTAIAQTEVNLQAAVRTYCDTVRTDKRYQKKVRDLLAKHLHAIREAIQGQFLEISAAHFSPSEISASLSTTTNAAVTDVIERKFDELTYDITIERQLTSEALVHQMRRTRR